jgi:hypothetical protein
MYLRSSCALTGEESIVAANTAKTGQSMLNCYPNRSERAQLLPQLEGAERLFVDVVQGRAVKEHDVID